MPAVASLLFPEPTLRRSPLAVWRWWEARRLTFNLIVGTTGLGTLLIVHLLFFRPALLLTPAPWLVALVYGLSANVCYSFGAPVELVLERWLGRETYGVGPALFRYGLIYSVGLTLFPIAFAAIGSIVGMILHVVR
jgi:hypothetical protein